MEYLSAILIGIFIGGFVCGFLRISIGRFKIYDASEGWQWRWTRFDEEAEKTHAAMQQGVEIGKKEERLRLELIAAQNPEMTVSQVVEAGEAARQ